MMSTYNGEKYLKEQLDSILNQEYVDVNLLIRDDGSTDTTVEIIESYQKKYFNITLVKGRNEGVIASFMDILFMAPNCSYYAFADQDDVWDRDKLICGIRAISETNKDKCLYFCKKRIVDANLMGMGRNDAYVRDTSLGCALLNSIASGCTMVFDNSLMKILRMYRPENTRISMHDAWIYRVAAAVGYVIYDDIPHMYYRQHGNNVEGAELTIVEHWKLRIRSLLNGAVARNSIRSDTAGELFRGYKDLLHGINGKRVLDLSVARKSYLARVRLVCSSYLKTQKKWEIIFIKIFIALGWI